MVDQKNAKNPVLIRFAFASVALFFIAQYFITLCCGEFYPAIMMPDFRGNGGFSKEGRVELDRPMIVFTAEDKSLWTFDQKQIFEPFPSGYHRTLSKFLLPIEKSEVESFPGHPTISRIFNRFFPGFHRGFRVRSQPEEQAKFRSWLWKRGRKMIPGRELKYAQILWYRDIFTPQIMKEGKKPQSVLAKIISVPFETERLDEAD